MMLAYRQLTQRWLRTAPHHSPVGDGATRDRPLGSALFFRARKALIEFGGGLAVVGTLTAAMSVTRDGQSGLALGTWGAVQTTAPGLVIALCATLCVLFPGLPVEGALGPALIGPSVGYAFVHSLEVVLLFATMIAVGLLMQRTGTTQTRSPSTRLGLAELP